jgi:GTP-binding protein
VPVSESNRDIPGWDEALRAGLDAYELDQDDRTLLDPGRAVPSGLASLPNRGSVAVVGRPNVGKSTLVNRIVGRREAVVLDTPGVTRDRVSYPAEWSGHAFTVVDTGGWDVDVAGMAARVAEQAEIAIGLADAVILVVDATVGITDTDQQVVRLLRRSGKPVVLAANKVDGASTEPDAAALWSLGLGEPWTVSALHGRGTGDLLDAVVAILPEGGTASSTDDGVRRVALVGRPNVGKSSLLNQLARSDRAVVDPVAGTTRDPVDEDIVLDGRVWRFVDTAGIRRRIHQATGADYYASLRTQAAIERSEVAVVLVDASQALAEQDVRVLQMAVDAGRATILALNKWDLMDPERRFYLERELEEELVQLRWIPRVNISALTGRRVDRLAGALDVALQNWDRRIPTGQLNAFLGELVSAHPHPVRGGKQPRILFATQASARPPHFVLFASGFLDPGYRRFVERRLRETFDFEGTPVGISVRVRERRKRAN